LILCLTYCWEFVGVFLFAHVSSMFALSLWYFKFICLLIVFFAFQIFHKNLSPPPQSLPPWLGKLGESLISC
jgi:hypothetical protein